MSRILFTTLFLTSVTMSASTLTNSLQPMPLPKAIRIEAASLRANLWEKLSARQKKLAYHLILAGRAGQDLLFFQNHRHGLLIKSILTRSLSAKYLPATKKLLGPEAFSEYLIYAAKFIDLAGPYASSNRKYVLTKVKPAMLENLIKLHATEASAPVTQEIVKLLVDPTFEVQRYPEDPKGAGLEQTGGNLYEKGVTAKEVLAGLDKTLPITLNTRTVRTGKNLALETYTVNSPGVVGKSLREVTAHLEKAKEFSESDFQKTQIQKMIEYFKNGDVEAFREANIAWVKDRSSSTIDFMMGFVEVYEDWLARIGSWESYVQIVDPEVSRLAQSLATHAQHFEDGMPYGKFKKKFAKDYSPPALMVYYFQELASYRSGGYNLPNFDDIRRDVGAKNVIRLPLPGEDQDPEFKELWTEVLNEFAPAEKAAEIGKHREHLYRVLVLLHEIIGHGSGTYDPSKYEKNQDPISGLGPLGSALEEQRADLTALVFAGDEALVEVGLYASKEEALRMRNLMYDFYLADFLRRTSGQRTFTEAHQRGHWLYINKLLKAKAIGWRARDAKSKLSLENQVLAVLDYDKVYSVSRDLLSELQNIKANRLSQDLDKLFKEFAPLADIDQPWAKSVIQRGQDLKINAGFIEQPWSIDSTLKFQSFGEKSLESVAPYFAR